MNQPLIPAPVTVRNATPAARLGVVTSIRSTTPATVGKKYDLVGGEVVKHQVANITAGVAQSHVVDTADALADLLKTVTGRTDTALSPALWHGDDGQPFDLVTEGELARLTGFHVGAPELAGILNREGRRRIAARLRRGLDPSVWLLLDLDNPPGIRPEWKAMNMEQRIAFLDHIVPGLAACERVQLRGSSARVVAPNGQPGGPTHAYVRVSNPEMIATLKAFVAVKMVTAGRSFKSPRFSSTTGEVVGHAHRTVFDLAVWDAGRLIFCAKPILSDAMIQAGWTVADANVEIVNPGAGPLNVSGFQIPDADMLAEYRRITGEALTYSGSGHNLSIRSRGVLTLATEVESKGVVRTFGEWLDTMADGDLVRCESPFRYSISEAAFMRRTGPGKGFMHDIGNGTTYVLENAPPNAEELDAGIAQGTAELRERMTTTLPPEVIAAAIAEQAPAREADALTTAAAAAQAAQGERVPVLCEEGFEPVTQAAIIEQLPRLPTKVFKHSGGLVYVSKSREIRVFDKEGRSTVVKTAGMMRADARWLGVELARIVAFMKTRNNRLKNTKPPYDLLDVVVKKGDLPVHSISGIISTPTMRPDGSLLVENGFDEVTGFWLDHDLTVSVPEMPTKEDAQAAFDVLCELLVGFPMDAMSESVAIAHMMAAVLRPAFPSMPGLLIEAPAAGSGKSYLTKTIGYLAHGVLPAVSNWPKNPEEFVKHLHAMLVAGVPYIAYDNCNGANIGGDVICSMLTEPQVKVRILSETREVVAPTTGVVLTVNGNHPRVMEDATQRFLTLYINPGVANPREREFTSDPLDLLRQDRGRFVSAVLTIAKAYIAAGRPGAVSYGSFERWSRLVRSAILWLTGDDVLTTTRAAIAEDPELQKLLSVTGIVLAAMGTGGRWTVKKLMERLAGADAMQVQILGGLVGVAAGRGGGLPDAGALNRAVGDYLRVKRDSVVTVDHDGRRLDVKLSHAGERDDRGRLPQDRNGAALWTVAVVHDYGPSMPGGEG